MLASNVFKSFKALRFAKRHYCSIMLDCYSAKTRIVELTLMHMWHHAMMGSNDSMQFFMVSLMDEIGHASPKPDMHA